MPTKMWLCVRYARYNSRGGCGRALSSNITGVRCSCSIARRTATRSGASSSSVELTKTRTRWSGVRIIPAVSGPAPVVTPPLAARFRQYPRPVSLLRHSLGLTEPSRSHHQPVARVSDLTYVSTWPGFAYTAFVIDAYGRTIVGGGCLHPSGGVRPRRIGDGHLEPEGRPGRPRSPLRPRRAVPGHRLHRAPRRGGRPSRPSIRR